MGSCRGVELDQVRALVSNCQAKNKPIPSDRGFTIQAWGVIERCMEENIGGDVVDQRRPNTINTFHWLV